MEFFQCFHSMRKDSCSWPQSFYYVAKLLEGAAPHLSRPMYAEANMGHPSRDEGFVLASSRKRRDQPRVVNQLSNELASQPLE
jgi:hypothetical protein